jgi:hypothetical protein
MAFPTVEISLDEFGDKYAGPARLSRLTGLSSRRRRTAQNMGMQDCPADFCGMPARAEAAGAHLRHDGGVAC